jgi:long-chain fatty acid transport protein
MQKFPRTTHSSGLNAAIGNCRLNTHRTSLWRVVISSVRRTSPSIAGFVLSLAPALAGATNGLNLIGYSAESVGMGGADVATARDASALNTNPAGICQIEGTRFDFFIDDALARDVAHADSFGNDVGVSNRQAVVANAGVVQHLATLPVSIGLGVFVQGGSGVVYKGVNTAFGTTDTLSAQLGFVKLAPGAAWNVTDALAIGVSAAATGGEAKERLFPGTSVFNPGSPQASFFGVELKNLEAEGLGARLGALYKWSPTVSLGASYIDKVSLPFSHGTAQVNYSAIGMGEVTYHDAKVDGLALPREADIGAAWQVTPDTLVSFKTGWLQWAGALKTETTTLSNPDRAGVPTSVQSSASLDWKNQFVFAVGAAWQIDPVTLYAGFNYGRNPIPASRTSPLLAAIGEEHLTGGMAYQFNAGWSASLSVEYLRDKEVTYTNPQMPFGPGAQERTGYTALGVQLSRQW